MSNAPLNRALALVPAEPLECQCKGLFDSKAEQRFRNEKVRLFAADIGGVQMFVQEGRWYNCNRLEVSQLCYILVSNTNSR